MNSTIKQTIGIGLLVTILAVAIFWGVLSSFQTAFGSAPSGLMATVATTTAVAVTGTQSRVFATSSCSARIVSTVASPITISFSDVQGFLPTGLVGHLQAASTTVAYDSGIYGCGAMRIFSFVDSTITVMETR